MQRTHASVWRAVLAPAALFVFEAAAVGLLWHLGSVPVLRLPPPDPAAWEAWLRFGDPADVLAAVVRAGALAAAAWLLASTVVYGIARVARGACTLRVSRWVTPAFVRRSIDGMVAVSLAGTLAGGRTGVAWAQETPRPPAGRVAAAQLEWAGAAAEGGVVVPADPQGDLLLPPGAAPLADPRPGAGRAMGAEPDVRPAAGEGGPDSSEPGPDISERGSAGVESGPAGPDQDVPGGASAPDAVPPASPSPVIPPSPSEAAVMPPKATADEQAQEPPGTSGPPGVPPPAGDARGNPALWTVQPGDSLWKIAARQVGAAGPGGAGRPIGLYWLRVVEANRRTIASGDPDLIRPGESITLPPLEEES